ncbi:GNAT family N-acetyltransferase [Sporosarcina beigongshangi]|uniref:GNAT family N-acetyltransferase n=1 Tax=Sporosarcina beigongshangi TaxID=2782538 RepID=UPI00193A0DBD|nr:GNAT family protein [Sporosarcina beigongshangi]
MDYQFKTMTQEQAEDIAYNWHYDGDYSFYDMEADQEDLVEFLDPEKRGNATFIVMKEHTMIGFFSFNQVEDNRIDMGLGMRPDLTGGGEGLAFVKAGLVFAESTFAPDKITLSVATFNKRAIKVYEKAGFEVGTTFMQETNGSRYEFLEMSFVVECH